MWVHGTAGDAAQHWGLTLNAAVMWICGAMAVRYAIARDFRTHRRWTLRLFLAVSGSWFYRAMVFLSFLIFRRPFGFDPATFTGPFLTFMAYANYLIPLGVAELYFLAQARPGALRRIAMATTLLVLTVAMSAGVFAVAAATWVPRVREAFDSRQSIGHALSDTIAANGLDAAIAQYRAIKAGQHAAWNFDEAQLNTLGYQFVRAHKLADAIRIFQLNVEAYPQSSNVYDSLGEAYRDAGLKALAVASYRKALELNPKNFGAAAALRNLIVR